MMSGRPSTATPVIIDCDPGVDDVVAILLALASPEIEILAFVTSYGNTDLDACHLNVFRVYHAIEKHIQAYPDDASRFPNFQTTDPSKRPLLVRGAAGPLQGDIHGAQYFHGRDGLGDISVRHADLVDGWDAAAEGQRFFRETSSSAADLTLSILKERPVRTITYLCLGPMTTLAETLRADAPTFRDCIGRVVCMGGALDVPGNTSPVAEFNWFADPWAVRELLMHSGHGLPLDRVIVLPLDITTPHELPFTIYRDRADPAFESTAKPSCVEDKPPLHHFTSSFLERTREIMLEFGKDAMELHDPAAMWFVLANPLSGGGMDELRSGWRAVQRVFDIERTGELTRGMCVLDRRADEGAYAPGSNRAFVQSQLDRVGISHGQYESTAVPAPVETQTSEQAHAAAGLSEAIMHPSPASASEETTSMAAKGIWCLVDTPGPQSILDLLLERIWGVAPLG